MGMTTLVVDQICSPNFAKIWHLSYFAVRMVVYVLAKERTKPRMGSFNLVCVDEAFLFHEMIVISDLEVQ